MTPPLAGLLSESVERHADGPALVQGARVLAYRDVASEVETLAGHLHSVLAGRDLAGARIAVVAPNSPLLVVSLFTAWRLGAVAVPLNARLREHELSQILADAEPAVVLSVPSSMGYAFTELLPRLPGVGVCLFADATGALLSESKQQSVTCSGRRAEQERLPPEMAAILYTSGTTGTPKGALVSHERELRACRELASVLELTAADRVALGIPASHAFGLTCLLAAFAAGAETVLVESTFSLGRLLGAIERHRATVLHGSPSLFASLLKARPDALATLRAGFVGGAAASPDLQARLDDLGVLNLYGLTETGAVCCCRPTDPPARRRTSAGRPLPGIDVRVDGGELQVRGAFRGYFLRPEETSAALDGDWFRTGDLAEIEDGYVRISGRRSELVHVGGFNVFPGEVEAVLLSHPDVLQAAVVGAEDEQTGEDVLRAFIVARAGSDLTPADLLRFARARIAGYKLPYAIRLLPELPLLPSGKPDRRALSAS